MAVPANSATRPYLQRRRVTGLAPAERPHATQEEGERLLPKAVQVILYTACLHSALYDLMDEMAQIGEYRHRKRRYLNMCIEKVGYIHTALFKTIGAHSDHFGRWYNAQLEDAEASIKECVLLQSPVRAYNIVRALFRMTWTVNEACGKFRCPAVVVNLPQAERLLDLCAFPIEDKHIDRILEMGVDTKDLTKKMKSDKLK